MCAIGRTARIKHRAGDGVSATRDAIAEILLERESYGELHHARRGQCALILAEASDIYEILVTQSVCCVKSH